MNKSTKLLAIDPSLTQSGWAIFSLASQKILDFGVIKSVGTSSPLINRLVDLQEKILALLEKHFLCAEDFLICEGPAPITLNPSSSIKVEQVRGIFETLARDRGVKVLNRLNPRTVQNELLGIKGKQLPRKEVKSVARSVFSSFYPELVKANPKIEQDSVDAILIGTLAQARIVQNIKLGIPVEKIFEQIPYSGRKQFGRNMRWPESVVLRK